MEELIARSSLGEPEALALRAETPPAVRDQLYAAVTQPESEPAYVVVMIVVPRRRWRTWPANFLRRFQDFYSRLV